jgi:cytochrome c5
MSRVFGAIVLALSLAGCGGGSEEAGASQQAQAAPHPGEQIYYRSCFSCHASGVAGAPRVGDNGAWAERLAKGRDELVRITREGMPPGMPPMGLCQDCSDADLGDVIDYMLAESGLGDAAGAEGN